MDPRGGNRRSRVLSRSTGFRSAPTGTKKHAGRPAGRSVSRTRKAENAQFWAGSRQGDGATRRRDRSRPQGAARTGCRRRRRARQLDVSRKAPARRTSGRLFSCHLSEVSDRREQLVRKIPRRATTSAARSAIRYLRDKATTEPEVLRRELRFFRKHRRRMRYANLKANGCALRRRPPTRSWSTSARARWSMRSECPHHRWSDRPAWRLEPRTKRRTPLDGENPAVKTGSLAKIDPHPTGWFAGVFRA